MCDQWLPPEQVSVIQSPWLDEISGLAVSRRYPDVAWVIEDSGNRAEIVAIRLSTGETVRRFRVRGAVNVDWEESALGACRPGSSAERAAPAGECLWGGEFGDNLGVRTDTALLEIPEPQDPGSRTGPAREDAVKAGRIPLVWPDGPHDTEAMAFSPDGSLYFWSKLRDGTSTVYRVTAGELKTDRVVTPAVAGSARITADGLPPTVTEGRVRWRVTAAVWAGDNAVLRTYEAALAIGLPGADGAVPVLGSLPAPVEEQGEAIGWEPEGSGSGGSLWFVSEGVRPAL